MKNYILFMFLLSGCSSASVLFQKTDIGIPIHQCYLPVLVGISSNVPLEDHKYITEAFQFWNKELGREIFYDMGVINMSPDSEEAAGLMLVGYPNTEETSKNKNILIARHKLTAYQESGCIIRDWIALALSFQNISNEHKSLTIKHELGHTLGLEDIKESGYIMSGTLPYFWDEVPTNLSSEEKKALNLFY